MQTDLFIAVPSPPAPLKIERTAEFSMDMRYRYRLGRRWDAGPIGGATDKIIGEALDSAVKSKGLVVVAWGAIVKFDDKRHPPAIRDRDADVFRVLAAKTTVRCFGTSASGAPTHPMARGKHRIPDGAPTIPFTLFGARR